MRWQILLLLAINLSLTRAGPVHRVNRRSPKLVETHYANTTDTHSTTEEASSTISAEAASTSSDSAFTVLPPSRITTSADKPVNEQKNGVDISPEGLPLKEEKKLSTSSAPSDSVVVVPSSRSSTTETTSPTISVSHTNGPSFGSSSSNALSSVHPSSSGQVPRLPSPSDLDLADLSNGDTGTTSFSAPSKTLTKASSSSYSASLSLSLSASPSSAADVGGAALAAFQKARNPESSTTMLTAEKQPASSATPTLASATSAFASVSSSILPTSTTTSSKSFNTATSSSQLPTESSSVRSSIESDTLFAASSKETSFVGQIPTRLLDEALSPSATSASLLPSRAIGEASQGTLASAGPDSTRVAQQFNDGFRNLNALSSCDPANADHVSACVQGQVARCEIDGTYSVVPCDKGQSCYAVPMSNGGNGVEVGCYSPEVAQNLIAPLQSSVASGATAGSFSTPAARIADSATQTDTLDTSLSSTQSQGSSAPYGALGLSRQSTSASTILAAPTSPTREAPSPDRATNLALAQDDSASSDADTLLASSSSAFADKSSSTYTALAPSSSVSPQGAAALENLGAQVSTKHHNQQDVSNGDNANAPSPSGVKLSFPGSTGSNNELDGSTPKAGNQIGDEGNTQTQAKPETNQKNAIIADNIPVSHSSASMPTANADDQNAGKSVPTSTYNAGSSSTSETLGITVAPALSRVPDQGFVTVTITRTTTVHDRN